MQTLKGQPAKGTTTKEFVDFMKDLKKKAEELTAKLPHLFIKDRDVVYSFDNPSIHQQALEQLEALGITQGDRAILPEYSPDIHKVIEHVHSIFQREFRKQLREDASIVTFQQYHQLVEDVFYGLSQSSIKKDVKSLSSTFDEIIRLGGDWPKKQFR